VIGQTALDGSPPRKVCSGLSLILVPCRVLEELGSLGRVCGGLRHPQWQLSSHGLQL